MTMKAHNWKALHPKPVKQEFGKIRKIAEGICDEVCGGVCDF